MAIRLLIPITCSFMIPGSGFALLSAGYFWPITTLIVHVLGVVILPQLFLDRLSAMEVLLLQSAIWSVSGLLQGIVTLRIASQREDQDVQPIQFGLFCVGSLVVFSVAISRGYIRMPVTWVTLPDRLSAPHFSPGEAMLCKNWRGSVPPLGRIIKIRTTKSQELYQVIPFVMPSPTLSNNGYCYEFADRVLISESPLPSRDLSLPGHVRIFGIRSGSDQVITPHQILCVVEENMFRKTAQSCGVVTEPEVRVHP